MKDNQKPFNPKLIHQINHQIEIIVKRLTAHNLLKVFFVIAVFALFVASVQFSTPNLPGNDGYYHIKMSYLMRTEGLKPEFNWLPLTILNAREFYNHHFLFHVLLIPFTFGDLVTGAKLAAVVFASLSFFLVWRLFDSQRVPYAVLWAFGLLAISEAFIYRMSLPRAQSLSLGLIVLALDWLLRGKHKRLFFLGFIYVWLYNAFPLLLAVAGAYVIGVWLIKRRLDVKPLIYSGVGIVLGIIINPYFPYSLVFIVQHILPKLMDATSVSVGSEWYPYTTLQLLENSFLSLALFISAIFALGLSQDRMKSRTATSLILVDLFGLMVFQSRRFIEYFPPFALIFAAFAWEPVLSLQKFRIRWNVINQNNKIKRFFIRHALLLSMLVVLLPATYLTLINSRDSVQSSKSFTQYSGVSTWLKDNTPAGERIFQTDWDDFPLLFFHNTHNTYLVGLDPTYLQLQDADLYSLWVKITRGEIENPSRYITDYFDAKYVLSDLIHRNFLSEAVLDPAMEEVYRDDEAVVFLITDQ